MEWHFPENTAGYQDPRAYVLPGSWLVATSRTSNRRGEGETTNDLISLLLGMKDFMKKLGKMKFGEFVGCLTKVLAAEGLTAVNGNWWCKRGKKKWEWGHQPQGSVRTRKNSALSSQWSRVSLMPGWDIDNPCFFSHYMMSSAKKTKHLKSLMFL